MRSDGRVEKATHIPQNHITHHPPPTHTHTHTLIDNPLNLPGLGPIFLVECRSRLYPHMRAKFGRDPTAGSKKLPFKFISRYLQSLRSINLSLFYLGLFVHIPMMPSKEAFAFFHLSRIYLILRMICVNDYCHYQSAAVTVYTDEFRFLTTTV